MLFCEICHALSVRLSHAILNYIRDLWVHDHKLVKGKSEESVVTWISGNQLAFDHSDLAKSQKYPTLWMSPEFINKTLQINEYCAIYSNK